MFRTAKFEAFIAPARRFPALWRLGLGLICGFAVFMVGSFVVIEIASRMLGLDGARSPGFVAALEAGETPVYMALVLLTFVPMMLGALVMSAWHWRGLPSLLGPRHGFVAAFAKGAAVIVFLTAGYFLIDLIDGGLDFVPHLSIAIWLSYLPWVIPLLFIQITAEELVFRGYLQQQLAARFQGAFWWMVLPSLIFAMGHIKLDSDPILAGMIVFATFIFGLIAADLTRITGNLGAAMGLHFANNFFSIVVIGVPGQLSGIALFHTPYRMEDVDQITGFLAIDIGLLVLIWLIGRRVLR